MHFVKTLAIVLLGVYLFIVGLAGLGVVLPHGVVVLNAIVALVAGALFFFKGLQCWGGNCCHCHSCECDDKSEKS